MPVPAVPRRAAPPRRKKETPKSSDDLTSPQEEEIAVREAEIPLPDSVPPADVEGEKTEVPSDVDLKPAHATEPSPPQVEDESLEPVKDSGLVTERSTSPTLVKAGDHEGVPEDACAPSLKEDQPMASLSEGKLAQVVEEGKKEIEERSGIDQPEQDLEEPLNEVSNGEEPTKPFGTAAEEGEHNVLTTEPDVEKGARDKTEEQPEEGGDDEATRRARITARLVQSGGFNPFAGGPPARKPSESSLPERRTSVESPGSFKPTLHEEQESPAQPLARRDPDSLIGETGLPTTETKEDSSFDTLKRAEGDS